MPITYHEEDLLKHLPSADRDDIPNLTIHEGQIVADDLSGCVSLIGPLKVCYDLRINPLAIKICLKVGSVTIVCGELNGKNPCLHLEGNYKVVKWDLKFCLDIKGRKITLKGTACALGRCKKFDVVIIEW